MSEEDIKKMINEVDPNNDGKISFDEFQQMMNAEGQVTQTMNIND